MNKRALLLALWLAGCLPVEARAQAWKEAYAAGNYAAAADLLHTIVEGPSPRQGWILRPDRAEGERP
ncbi:MAG TPA: hypothetical protein VK886_06510 [Vicinamibacterales bacterium]|nr:hypothetical protein [Vicinamibacterales bacterium]